MATVASVGALAVLVSSGLLVYKLASRCCRIPQGLGRLVCFVYKSGAFSQLKIYFNSNNTIQILFIVRDYQNI